MKHALRRQRVLELTGTTLLLDVGANAGQHVTALREHGYTGRVVSFEPVPEAYAALTQRHGTDPQWSGLETALGAQTGRAGLTVTDDSRCSSLLAVGAIADFIPVAAPARDITVEVHRLDELWDGLVHPDDVVALKIDTQGFEGPVLEGLGAQLDRVQVLEVEMALTPLYEGGGSLTDLLPQLVTAGFGVVSFDDGHVDRETGQVLDVDVLLRRR